MRVLLNKVWEKHTDFDLFFPGPKSSDDPQTLGAWDEQATAQGRYQNLWRCVPVCQCAQAARQFRPWRTLARWHSEQSLNATPSTKNCQHPTSDPR